MAREGSPGSVLPIVLLLFGCGAAEGRGVEAAPEMRTAIDAAEAPVLANVAAMLDRVQVYRSTVEGRDDTGELAAAYPDRGYVDTVLSGPVLGTEALGTPLDVRTIEIWSHDAMALVGFGEGHHRASLFRRGSWGGLGARCAGCVVEAEGGTIEIHGIFTGENGDGSASHVELDGRLEPIPLGAATAEELALFVDALDRSAYLLGFLRDGAHVRLDGTELSVPGLGGVVTEREGTATHGCVEVFGYHLDRVIDLADTTRRTVRVTSLDGRTERCCPRDATGAPCSPGPRCDVRALP